MAVAVSTVGGYGQTLDAAGATLSDPVMTTKHGIAALGQGFVTTTTTPGTAFAYPLTTAYTVNSPLLYLFNSAPVGGKNVYLDYIKLITVTVTTAVTVVNYAINLDTGARTLSPDNTATLTPANTNLTSSLVAGLQVKAQNSTTASTLSAAAAPRIIGRGSIGGLPIVGDELIIDFGCDDITPSATSATAGRKVSSAPAFCLCPQTSVAINLWFPNAAANAWTYELEMGHWER